MSALDMWHLYRAARQRRKEQWYLPYAWPIYGRIEHALNRLPVLEKAILRSSAEDMVTEAASGIFPVNTSGSTGAPCNSCGTNEIRPKSQPCGPGCSPPTAGGPSTVRSMSGPGEQLQKRDRSSAAVRSRFVELGNAFEYEAVCVDDLPVAPSGKFQTIVQLEEP